MVEKCSKVVVGDKWRNPTDDLEWICKRGYRSSDTTPEKEAATIRQPEPKEKQGKVKERVRRWWTAGKNRGMRWVVEQGANELRL